MAESSNSRTAYLVVTHPDDASVRSVISFTQQQTPPTTTSTTLQAFYFRSAAPCGGGQMKTLRSTSSLANKVSGLTNLPGESGVVYEFNSSSQYVGNSQTPFDGTFGDLALCGTGGTGGTGGCILAGELI